MFQLLGRDAVPCIDYLDTDLLLQNRRRNNDFPFIGVLNRVADEVVKYLL